MNKKIKKQNQKRNQKRNQRTNQRRKISNRKPRKWSIKQARMISKKKYESLLRRKKLTLSEKKQLDRALFVNYCKCIKTLKYSKKYSKGSEYPICNQSIYKQRNLKSPKNVNIRCRDYY